MKLSHVSPSQFKTFALCRRKWFIEKCTGLPRTPATKGQALGSAVHAELEAWAKSEPEPKGTTDRVRALADLARGLIGDLPSAVSGGEALIERKLWLRDDIDPPMLGFVDVLDGRGDVVSVVDYKTTTSIAKYGLDADALAVDVQLVPYALWAMRELDRDVVEVAHLQIQTKGPAIARLVSATVTIDAANKQWRDYFVPQAAAMRALAASGSAVGDVPPTYTACSAFGGCPHAATCLALRKTSDTPAPATPFGRLSTLTPGNKMADLRALMASKTLRTAGATADESAALSGAVVAVADRDAWPELAATLLADHRAALAGPVPTGINPPAVEATTPTDDEIADALAAVEDNRVRVAPVADVVADAPSDGLVEKPLGAASRKTPADYRALSAKLLAAVERTPTGSLAPSLAALTARQHFDAKRLAKAHIEAACLAEPGGRLVYTAKGHVLRVAGAAPPEVVSRPDVADVIEQATAPPRPEPAVVVDPETPRRVEPSPRATEGLHVFIDCRPAKINGAFGPVLTFAELVEPLVAKVAKANCVADPLLMDYGKGRFEVAALLRSLLPLSGALFVDSRNPYWGDASHVVGVVASTLVYGS